MTSDEAEAAQWLDEQFWSNLRNSHTKFLWLPKRNAQTGKLMWLCTAVGATSGWCQYEGQAEFEYTQTKWFEPKDFTILALRYTR